MCGIAGFISSTRLDKNDAINRAEAMALRITHRGPDDAGAWSDGVLGLAHRRLSIIDITSTGKQPMESFCGRYIGVYNGETYNYLSLKKELDKTGTAIQWIGTSDTEVLMAGVSVWGVERTLHRMNGMFAFAIYDRKEHRLILARDRFGEKPLYFGYVGKDFVFASELKALHDYPGWDRRIDNTAVVEYLRYGYVPSPLSIYCDIHKVGPGAFVTIDLERGFKSGVYDTRQYWTLDQVVAGERTDEIDESECLSRIHGCLRDAVSSRMVADVPVGAFLSGGIDSSLVVSLMQETSSSPVKTFTIGFDTAEFDESGNARSVANHLGTEHQELVLSEKGALDVVPLIPGIYDEPFSDPSQIPTYVVSRLAAEQVKVVLSGDAGDETFCGYVRFVWMASVGKRLHQLPRGAKRSLARIIQTFSTRQWDMLFKTLFCMLPSRQRAKLAGHKVHKLAAILEAVTTRELYIALVSIWRSSEIETLLSRDIKSGSTGASGVVGSGLSDVELMMFWDSKCYLPDDILTKVDRASMANSLEVRVPFLDHRLVESVWQLPLHLKLRNGESKWMLRRVLDDYLPRGLYERPKMGFSVPVGRWLRNELRDWAEAQLSGQRLVAEGYFDSAAVSQLWQDHQRGLGDNGIRLWTVLMFQSWLAEFA